MNWKKHCDGCGECCGPVPFEPSLWNKHKDKAQDLSELIPFIRGTVCPLSNDLFCVFLDRKTKLCLIYDERPDVCKKQGTIPQLPCPKIHPELSKAKDIEVDDMFKRFGVPL